MKSAVKIATIVKNWLDPKNLSLQQAVDKTISEALFNREDIEFQLSVLRKNVENGEIEEWVKQAELSEEHNAQSSKVLCLHAGNLPLVGFQTALGSILSGADYYAKLSRKDPYLLASFLDEVKKTEIAQKIEYSTNLAHFKDLQADRVVFAGSEESVPEVKKEINKLRAAKPNSGYLIRTAKFSIVYIADWNSRIGRELVEAMLRYGGKGCRSAAVVVSKFGLSEVKDELQVFMQAFWKEHPQRLQPTPDLRYQYAYNKAVGRGQLWMKDFLIQETEEEPETDFAVNWVKGGGDKVRELRMKFGELVQTVYTTGDRLDGLKTEPLSSAQKPSIWWKPDGIDILKELIT